MILQWCVLFFIWKKWHSFGKDIFATAVYTAKVITLTALGAGVCFFLKQYAEHLGMGHSFLSRIELLVIAGTPGLIVVFSGQHLLGLIDIIGGSAKLIRRFKSS
jgi:hypothetical protein